VQFQRSLEESGSDEEGGGDGEGRRRDAGCEKERGARGGLQEARATRKARRRRGEGGLHWLPPVGRRNVGLPPSHPQGAREAARSPIR